MENMEISRRGPLKPHPGARTAVNTLVRFWLNPSVTRHRTDRPSGCGLSVRGAAGRQSEARGEEGKVRGVRGRRQEEREREGGSQERWEEEEKRGTM